MKKILLIGMIVIMAFTLCACGKKKGTAKEGAQEGTDSGEVTLTYTIKNRYNTYSLYSNGEVYAKGTNKCGELGLGHKVEIQNEVKIEGLTGIQKIVIQQNEERGSAYFIDANGEVYVTGYNGNGQLGLGHTQDIITPTKIEGLTGIADIEVSEYDSCNTYFITQNGEVYVTGANTNGELGIGSKTQIVFPTKIEQLAGEKIKKIVYAEGFGYAVFLTELGEVYISGNEEIVEQKYKEPEPVDDIVGSLFGNIPTGEGENISGNEPQDESLSGPEVVTVNEENKTENVTIDEVKDISVNQEEPVNENAQEIKIVNNPTIPVKIETLKGIKVINIIDEGDNKSFSLYYITDNGEVYASGHNRSGKLGVEVAYNRKNEEKRIEYVSGVFPQRINALNGIQIKDRVDKKFIGMNDEKYGIITGDVPRAKQEK